MSWLAPRHDVAIDILTKRAEQAESDLAAARAEVARLRRELEHLCQCEMAATKRAVTAEDIAKFRDGEES